MKLFQYGIVILTLGGLLFSSCQKVIDIDLNSEDPQIVIEGTFTAGETTHHVRITNTLNFNQTVAYPTVDNATVMVTDNLGNSQPLTFVSDGQYYVNNYPVVEGRSYTLTVVVDGKSYVAVSTVPNQVLIDTLMVGVYPFGQEAFNAMLPVRLDPAGVSNYYQFHLYRNGKRLSGIYLQDDQFTDGIVVQQPIFDNGGDYKTGDTAYVEMFCIDKPVYDYFFALQQNATATPANPKSNFSGGCLGYFSARTRHGASVIIP